MDNLDFLDLKAKTRRAGGGNKESETDMLAQNSALTMVRGRSRHADRQITHVGCIKHNTVEHLDKHTLDSKELLWAVKLINKGIKDIKCSILTLVVL